MFCYAVTGYTPYWNFYKMCHKTFMLHVLYDMTSTPRRGGDGGGVTGDCITSFVSVISFDIFEVTVRQFPALSVTTKSQVFLTGSQESGVFNKTLGHFQLCLWQPKRGISTFSLPQPSVFLCLNLSRASGGSRPVLIGGPGWGRLFL